MRKAFSLLKEKVARLFSASPAERHALVGQKRLWKMKRKFQIDFLQGVGLKPHHWLLDLGCGTLRGGIPLIVYLNPGHYYGLESREIVLAEAKLELREAGLENKKPTLLHSPDLGVLQLGQAFDYIWAFSVLIHMNDEVLGKALHLVDKHLGGDGAFYANVNLGDGPDSSWQGFPVVFRSLDFYQKVAAEHHLRITDMGTLASVGHISGIEAQDQGRMLKFTKK